MNVDQATEKPFIDPKTGQLRVLTDTERRAYFTAAREMIRDLDTITDETDDDEEGWNEIFRNLGAIRSGGAS